MANHVDQLHARIQAVDKDGKLTPFMFRWLISLWERTGGPNDVVTELENGELYETGVIDSRLSDQTNKLQAIESDLDTVSNSKISILEKRIDDLQKDIDSTPNTPNLQKQIEELQNEFDTSPIWTTPNLGDFQLISTSTAFTTTGKQIIVVTSNVTITLNTKPKDGEIAIIKRVTTAGAVTIDGGTINIDGATTYTLLVNYESAQCIYSYADDEWLII